MIVYPEDWRNRGSYPSLLEIDNLILTIIEELDCKNLSLSGGLDSSLLLWYMIKVFGSKKVKCFNSTYSVKHPDYFYSEQVTRCLGVDCYHFILDESILAEKRLLSKLPGDEIISVFYNNLQFFHHISDIITGDGIDEIAGGYYTHADKPTDETYFDFLRRLQKEQLEPLNINSGDIKVFLPYMDYRLISLLSFIPLWDKFSLGHRKKIINNLAKGKIPDAIIKRRKYGFCDAAVIKEDEK